MGYRHCRLMANRRSHKSQNEEKFLSSAAWLPFLSPIPWRRIIIALLFAGCLLAGVTYLALIRDYQAAAMVGVIGLSQLAIILVHWSMSQRTASLLGLETRDIP
jgi:hypothetical protein